MKQQSTYLILLAFWMGAQNAYAIRQDAYADSTKHPLIFINTNFENASQLDWEVDQAGVVQITFNYDHERSSPNRANGHWHFQVVADKGSELTIVLKDFKNIWNGMAGVPISEKTNTLVSEDGKNWKVVHADLYDGSQLKFRLQMTSDKLFIASVEPYRISDLDQLLAGVRNNPLVQITPAGYTAEGRPLEIVRVGKENAPHRIFLRARAHAWEPGGNWVVQGLIRSLLEKDGAKYLDRYCVYIMPMANKDGVARGRTRFNTLGKDLNREWDRPADRELTPEKYAFESWLLMMIDQGKKPELAIDLHNDQGGNLHVNLPTPNNLEYTAKLKKFEAMLFKHTWFREGYSHVRNPGSFGEGLLARFGINACVYELNYEWAKGLNKKPMGKDWELLGKQLRDAFYEYFQ
jgi:hypothetical protein